MVIRGFYVHYKGGCYFVHGLARNMDGVGDDGDAVVIYDSVQSTDFDPQGHKHVDDGMRYRTVHDFEELVDPATGHLALEGGGIPRFQRVVGWTRDGRPRVKITGAQAVFGGEYEGP